MAWVLIGGLITSTVFTLLVIPVVYTLAADFRGRFKGRPGGGARRLLCVPRLPRLRH